MERKRSQNKEMCFGEFGDLNNLLPISSSEDVDNIGTSKKKVSKNANENPSDWKLIFEEPAMVENQTKMILVGQEERGLASILKCPGQRLLRKTEVPVPCHEAKDIEDSSKNMVTLSYELIVQIGNEFASTFVMRTLGPRKWLEDVGKLWEEKLDIKGISSYLRKNRYGGNIAECEKVFIPVNVGNTHWYCLLVEFTEKKLFILDSLQSRRRNKDVKALAEAFNKAFCAIFETKYEHNVSSYVLESPELPKQNNLYDCGVYVIKFMEALEIDKMKNIKSLSVVVVVVVVVVVYVGLLVRNKILKLKLQLPYGKEVFLFNRRVDFPIALWMVSGICNI
ncbi:hypothetical protein M9H77_02718 [Catharanthus roseus]|uniref:Uncharacterized protein n=1 Tax=Catharanthus roseus TaxID=4058 RepID=A0ACC0C9D5_CATRO|nr:hypothetical protein M9H77_02718 [Catharanthus roseus]